MRGQDRMLSDALGQGCRRAEDGELRWRCVRCRGTRIDMVVTSHARVLPWAAVRCYITLGDAGFPVPGLRQLRASDPRRA